MQHTKPADAEEVLAFSTVPIMGQMPGIPPEPAHGSLVTPTFTNAHGELPTRPDMDCQESPSVLQIAQGLQDQLTISVNCYNWPLMLIGLLAQLHATSIYNATKIFVAAMHHKLCVGILCVTVVALAYCLWYTTDILYNIQEGHELVQFLTITDMVIAIMIPPPHGAHVY